MGPEYDRPAWELALDHGRREGLDAALADHLRPGRFDLDHAYAALVEDAGAVYLDRMEVLCPERACPALVPGEDALVLHDNTHMTLQAAQLVGRSPVVTRSRLFDSSSSRPDAGLRSSPRASRGMA